MYIATFLETVDSFWTLFRKCRFPKLKDISLKIHSTFGRTYALLVLKLVSLLFHK